MNFKLNSTIQDQNTSGGWKNGLKPNIRQAFHGTLENEKKKRLPLDLVSQSIRIKGFRILRSQRHSLDISVNESAVLQSGYKNGIRIGHGGTCLSSQPLVNRGRGNPVSCRPATVTPRVSDLINQSNKHLQYKVSDQGHQNYPHGKFFTMINVKCCNYIFFCPHIVYIQKKT